jgi:hypothetical protein
MPIALYTKGRTHTVASESDPDTKLDCTIKLVNHNDDRILLLAQGDHFDSVDDLYAPAVEEKPKKGRKSNPVVGAEEVVKSDETET